MRAPNPPGGGPHCDPGGGPGGGVVLMNRNPPSRSLASKHSRDYPTPVSGPARPSSTVRPIHSAHSVNNPLRLSNSSRQVDCRSDDWAVFTVLRKSMYADPQSCVQYATPRTEFPGLLFSFPQLSQIMGTSLPSGGQINYRSLDCRSLRKPRTTAVAAALLVSISLLIPAKVLRSQQPAAPAIDAVLPDSPLPNLPDSQIPSSNPRPNPHPCPSLTSQISKPTPAIA